ncbi:MAG: nitrate reductase molybdenum cofactor assembly chaperone [Actinomycetes bacterium]|jgi:nitrate reductase delta subunit|nr:nitrate reductase molybdenum cofactor assembly chaperone [Actinomycetes bacterium]
MRSSPVAAMAASVLLRYPDPPTLAALPVVRAALAELPRELAAPLGTVVAHRETGDPTELAAEYVQLFDLRRRCCLHLTYYTAGDTRARGQALVEFAEAFRAAGFAVGDGELPDYLPAVLELAARTGEPGWALLRGHRIGLDLLEQALTAKGPVYRPAVSAVLGMLPPAGTAELAAATRLARNGPPREQVGLEPFVLDPTGPRVGGRR